MIIKKSRLETFMKEYDAKIGTDVEWEDWNIGVVHIFGADIETMSESRIYNELYDKYNIEQ